ncbi:hypothetical protein MA16_Dca015623 [Dendrobium catenatum]|uniref:Nodulin-like domain-containing protein n=1 Tax=Dendrobium catenatum TaxID=906689 RepID=A0A2I0WJA3_9ASPA|nr:hypothetical protein MA16_Dca015623 [Dendrobium catenatum]
MSALPWLTISTIIWLQAIAGTNTDFPAYSSELKSRLHITQFKLNNLAAAKYPGGNLSHLSIAQVCGIQPQNSCTESTHL